MGESRTFFILQDAENSCKEMKRDKVSALFRFFAAKFRKISHMQGFTCIRERSIFTHGFHNRFAEFPEEENGGTDLSLTFGRKSIDRTKRQGVNSRTASADVKG